jgi:heme/copper-type cytochrome/quinol oxidase subunit 2
MTASSDVDVLADHTLLLALPAFAPAVIVVGVVIYVAMKDRRTADDEDADDKTHRGDPASADEDGAP